LNAAMPPPIIKRIRFPLSMTCLDIWTIGQSYCERVRSASP
jgi:hypothetical protein